MLNVFRENLRHLKWVLLLVVASFIFTIFALWGGGVDRGGPAGSATLWAARIGEDVIPLRAFQNEARNLEATYQQLLGAQYSQQRRFIRIGRQAINNLVNRELLTREAVRVGLKITDQEVAEAIMQEPAFQQDGAFIGKERYERIFKSNQSGLKEYEEQVRRTLLLGKLRALLQDSVTVSDDEVRAEYVRQSEKITLEYLLFENSSLEIPEPGDEQVRTYYEQHLDDYLTGEGRSGRLVPFDARDIAAGIEVPESEIHSRYTQDLKKLYTTPERRRASHILIKLPPNPTPEEVDAAEQRARVALERVRGGEDFAEVAREVSEDTTGELGGDLNYFTRDQMVPEFSEAVWSLEVGQTSDLVRSAFGFHVIRVTDVQPLREMSLEEARPQILSLLKDERSQAEAQRRAQKFVELARAEGADFEEVAAEVGVVARSFDSVYLGDPIPELGVQAGVTARLFTLEKDEVSDPIPTEGGQVVVQFLSATPSVPSPFEKIKDRARRDFEEAARLELVREKLAKAGGTAELASTARKLKMELQEAGPVPRTGAISGIGGGEELMDRLFALGEGEVEGPRSVPSGVAVIRVLSHTDPMEGFEGQAQSTRTSLLYAKRDRFFQAYLEKLREGSEIEVNQTLIDQVDQA